VSIFVPYAACNAGSTALRLDRRIASKDQTRSPSYHRRYVCSRPVTALPSDHPVGLVFVDETSDEHYFGIGCLKLRDPHQTLTALAQARAKYNFQGKLRWADVGGYAEPRKQLVRDILLALARDSSASFNCVLADLSKIGGLASYGSRTNAYIQLTTDGLTTCADDPAELIAVIADQFDTRSGVRVEPKIVEATNSRKRRLAVVAMQRVGSAGTDGLQLADLLLGAVAYSFRSAIKPAADTSKNDIALALMTEGYGLSAYHDRSGGREIPGRLTIELIPRRRHGQRGGRRPKGS
jgi:hypothetical protein